MSLLRIGAQNPKLAQMNFQPGTSTYPGYGLILLFESTELRDGQNNLLARGTIVVRVRPATVSSITLAMLGRLLCPFAGYFVMIVEGAATIDATATSAEVLADDVVATNIQPS